MTRTLILNASHMHAFLTRITLKVSNVSQKVFLFCNFCKTFSSRIFIRSKPDLHESRLIEEDDSSYNVRIVKGKKTFKDVAEMQKL